jgi:hypothetical protein
MAAGPQLELRLEKVRPVNLTFLVGHILSTGKWMMPHEIQRVLKDSYGEMHSDSSITARLRDLRKAKFGAYTIEKRKREGSNAYEYRLVR